MATTTTSPTTVFEQLGATPVINARGNQTVLGGSTPSPRVRRAMLDAERYYVDMGELLERSGAIVAELLGAEAAYITPGCAAALALGTAACMAGADPAKVAQLPDTTGLPNKVLIQKGHHYHYEHVVTVPGAKLTEVDGSSPASLDAALDSSVANVLVPAHLDGAPGTQSLAKVIELAHAKNIPVLVDAAGRIFPIEMFKKYAHGGADLVGFGAKYIGALNGSGILVGRPDLVKAASTSGFVAFETTAWEKAFGRPLKLDRQTIVAVVEALREWLETDHDARLRGYERRLDAMRSELDGAPGVKLRIVNADGPSPRTLHVELEPGKARTDADGVTSALLKGNPAVAVGRAENTIIINPVTLREEDDGVVVSRLGSLLL